MKTEDILKNINDSYKEINVNTNLHITPAKGSYVREFNRGKSFEFSE